MRGTRASLSGKSGAPNGTFTRRAASCHGNERWQRDRDRSNYEWRDHSTLAPCFCCSYQLGVYSVSMTQNFQSGYWDAPRATDPCVPGCTSVHQGAFSTWDLQTRYSGFKFLDLRLGVKIVFNRLPSPAISLGNYAQQG